MATHIRLAKIEDTPAMARVMVDTWLAAHRDHVPEGQWQRRREEWSYSDSERGWRRLLEEIAAAEDPQDCVYVAVTDADEIVGLAVGCPTALNFLKNAAEVSAVYIRSRYQGLGLGRRLIRAVATHQANLGRTALLICVLETNASARGFYAALGGCVVGKRETEDFGYKEPQIVYGWEDIGDLAQSSSRAASGEGERPSRTF